MEYTVLARRFRPQTFHEVVGQDMVAQALRNAISSGRVAHAFLFTGARGVGKTSMARILSKALNCPDVKDGVPCNICDTCRAISTGADIDVLEIDGASNRGIEDIRTLRANVNVRSMRSRHKIYIIDEVHMLTRDAFNALLKTLEEPPPNVKFIFCTTEPEKIPDTILSRCQRFDFGTIATRSIGDRLQQIAVAEGVEVEPAAVALVARRAAGSMRDSQSLFDQLLAFGGKKIAAADVHRLLGTAPDERLVELMQHAVERRPDLALQALDVAIQAGVQPGEFLDQLIAYNRDLMILAAGDTSLDLSSVASEQRPMLRAQAQALGLATVIAALQILSDTRMRMKGVTFGRTLVELGIVRISTLADLALIGNSLDQLKQLALQGATAPPAAPRLAIAPESAPAQRAAAPVEAAIAATAESVEKKKP